MVLAVSLQFELPSSVPNCNRLRAMMLLDAGITLYEQFFSSGNQFFSSIAGEEELVIRCVIEMFQNIFRKCCDLCNPGFIKLFETMQAFYFYSCTKHRFQGYYCVYFLYLYSSLCVYRVILSSDTSQKINIGSFVR